MFSKLRDKLKGALSIFSRKTEEEAVEKKAEQVLERPVVKEKVEENKPKVESKKPILPHLEKKEKEAPFTHKKVEGKKKETVQPKNIEKAEREKIEIQPKKNEEKKEIPKKEKIKGIKITYFVHGTTTDNEQGLCTGWNPGKLSEAGRQQSIQLRNLIGKEEFDVIFCSDLQRAVDSARLAFAKDPYKIVPDQRLRECNYGELNGQDEAKVKIDVTKRIYQPFPQGESYHQVELRVADFLNEIWKPHYGKHIAIVAHQAPQLALEVLLKGKTWEQAFKEDWRNTKNWQPGWVYWMEQEVKVSEVPAVLEEEKKPESKSGFFGKFKKTFTFKKEEAKAPEPVAVEEPTAEPKLAEKEIEQEEPGFFQKIKQTITTKTISAEKFEELFWDLELALLENNVSVEVIDKIKIDLKSELVDKPLPREVETKIMQTLTRTLKEILSYEPVDIPALIRNQQKKPFIIAFFGINGTGKTTSIAKLTHYLQQRKISVVLAACDTFRAAAIQQLEEHADKLKVKMIKHDYGSDSAAVAFDAVKYAEKNKIDVVMIDTAGRLHSNTNLMEELKKIIKVTQPDLKIFVGESITGNDCIEQARKFNELVEMDGVILTKADVDEKGGAPLSISYTIKKPILFLGVGQRYEDLEEFDADVIMERLGL